MPRLTITLNVITAPPLPRLCCLLAQLGVIDDAKQRLSECWHTPSVCLSDGAHWHRWAAPCLQGLLGSMMCIYITALLAEATVPTLDRALGCGVQLG